MTCAEVMAQLESMGTAQNVKIYRRHGMKDPMFGVSFANLKLLKKKIKVNQVLAEELWQTGNTDARNLALMIADPATITGERLDSWVGDAASRCFSDSLGGLTAKTPFAWEKVAQWTPESVEGRECAGWVTLGVLAYHEDDTSDAVYEPFIEKIERTIHDQKNFTRLAMNMALIAIGTRSVHLKDKAQAAAQRIGKVHVDHGDTDCKTPEAVSYIEKAFAHRHRKQLGKK